MKKIIRLEYSFQSVSAEVLWEALTAPHRLRKWFAEEVEATPTHYTFYWDKEPHKARVSKSRKEKVVHLNWENEESTEQLCFTIHTGELTGETTLEILDKCPQDEVNATLMVWDTQIANLQRMLGVI